MTPAAEREPLFAQNGFQRHHQAAGECNLLPTLLALDSSRGVQSLGASDTGLDASQIGFNAAPLVCVQVLQDPHSYGALQALPGLQQKLLQKQMLGLEAQLVELQRTL